MGVQGHPDWLRTPVGINNIFVNTSLTPPINGVIVGTFFVADYTALSITFNNVDLAAYLWLEIRWDTTNTPNPWSSRDAISVGPGTKAVTTVPVQGSWMQLVAFSDTVVTSLNPLLVYGTTSTITPDMDRENNYLLISDSSAYTSNQVKTLDAVNWFSGPTVFSFSSSSPGGGLAFAEVRIYDRALKLHVPYMEIGIPLINNAIPTVLYVPKAHLRVVVANGTTAQTINTLVTPAPLFG